MLRLPSCDSVSFLACSAAKCWDAATSMVANAMKAREKTVAFIVRERREDGREMSRNGGGDVGLARMSA